MIRVQLSQTGLQQTKIERRRGDTFDLEFECYDEDGSPLDTSTGTFLIAVNALRSPTSSDAPEFVLTGSGSGNVVTFPMTPAEADRVGAFFYDMQETDSGGLVRSFIGGPFVLAEDVTKGPSGESWIADPSIPDGTPHPMDGSNSYWIPSSNDGFTAEYQTREAVKVLRIKSKGTYDRIDLNACGELAGKYIVGPTGVYRYDLLLWSAFMSRLYVGNYEESASAASACAYLIFQTDTYTDIEVAAEGGEEQDEESVIVQAPAGYNAWARIAFEIDFDAKTLKGKAWGAADDEPTAWDVETPGISIPSFGVQEIVLTPWVDSSNFLDIAEFSWTKVG